MGGEQAERDNQMRYSVPTPVPASTVPPARSTVTPLLASRFPLLTPPVCSPLSSETNLSQAQISSFHRTAPFTTFQWLPVHLELNPDS